MRPLAEIDHHLAKGTGARDQTRVSALSKLMNTDPVIASESNNNRYEAVVRMTEALSTCHEPEKLAPTLADEIGRFLQFDHLYLLVLKENSTEIEYLVWGKNPIPVPERDRGAANVGRHGQRGNTAYCRLGDRRAVSAIQAMGKETGPRLECPRAVNDDAPSIGCVRNHSRHSESIQR